MSTALYSHADCHAHVTPPGHPERVERLEAVAAVLSDDRFSALDRRDAPMADRPELLRCHPERYVARIEAAIPAEGSRALDADTHISSGSWAAALRAVGAAVAAVDAVLDDEIANAFCATRPPGHHAEAEKPMGFCLFGNAAIAAKRALDQHGLSRVAVVDFDVHHGNGTQDLLWDEARTLFVGSHQMPLWPGTGDRDETGAHGNVMNLPLSPGTNGAGFRRVWETHGLPALDSLAPELIVISAGFDAHEDDPLAQLALQEVDFAWITEALCDLADTHADGRIVSTLEGGYDLNALAASTAAHVDVLMRRGR
ncbi:histone deacetylase family protein [Roseobacter sinensis]|uniref:Histone deacetylase family protein n=1 Tax=Roseobacter sinensis TaxID=2931391 RepID=A0ABT3BLA3_9RHOB|nr:histone deacetylase family protein [Roseobacter sp. WL0113]MCV3274353.1 histone deacetylase family protein [Roseobacter sp. WL0113]